jgi:hypothetical protein
MAFRHHVAAKAPRRALLLEANRLARIRRGTLRPPSDWTAASFDSEVSRIAAQLQPIRSRDALASSFAREAASPDPVRVAYAGRWIELAPRRA